MEEKWVPQAITFSQKGFVENTKLNLINDLFSKFNFIIFFLVIIIFLFICFVCCIECKCLIPCNCSICTMLILSISLVILLILIGSFKFYFTNKFIIKEKELLVKTIELELDYQYKCLKQLNPPEKFAIKDDNNPDTNKTPKDDKTSKPSKDQQKNNESTKNNNSSKTENDNEKL